MKESMCPLSSSIKSNVYATVFLAIGQISTKTRFVLCRQLRDCESHSNTVCCLVVETLWIT